MLAKKNSLFFLSLSIVTLFFTVTMPMKLNKSTIQFLVKNKSDQELSILPGSTYREPAGRSIAAQKHSTSLIWQCSVGLFFLTKNWLIKNAAGALISQIIMEGDDSFFTIKTLNLAANERRIETLSFKSFHNTTIKFELKIH